MELGLEDWEWESESQIDLSAISQRSTFQSVEEESSLCPLRFQLSDLIGSPMDMPIAKSHASNLIDW